VTVRAQEGEAVKSVAVEPEVADVGKTLQPLTV
jgi:hypothetical protein